MKFIRQVSELTKLALLGIPQRLWSSLVIVVGVTIVVAVLMSAMSLSRSLTSTITSAGDPGRAIILRSGADAESVSTLLRDSAMTVETAPGIRRNANGKPLASPEVVASVNASAPGGKSESAVTVRGLTPIGFEVRPEIKITEGRAFTPGLREVIVGKAAQVQFGQLNLGDTVTLHGAKWTVVGTFASGGSSRESELLVDAETFISDMETHVYQSMTVRLESEDAYVGLKSFLDGNKTLNLQALPEPVYYRQQSTRLGFLLSLVAYAIGGIMSLGALFGAINTLYTIVAMRGGEIATLRAIGFGGFGVVVSVLAETLMLALVGALAGSAISWVLIDGHSIDTFFGSGQLVARLDVRSSDVITACVWACAMGAIGGLFPAVRAARIPVTVALREA